MDLLASRDVHDASKILSIHTHCYRNCCCSSVSPLHHIAARYGGVAEVKLLCLVSYNWFVTVEAIRQMPMSVAYSKDPKIKQKFVSTAETGTLAWRIVDRFPLDQTTTMTVTHLVRISIACSQSSLVCNINNACNWDKLGLLDRVVVSHSHDRFHPRNSIVRLRDIIKFTLEKSLSVQINLHPYRPHQSSVMDGRTAIGSGLNPINPGQSKWHIHVASHRYLTTGKQQQYGNN